MDQRKYRTVDTYRLLDMLEQQIRKDIKKPTDESAMTLADIKTELITRCFEVDRELEVVEKKKGITVKQIEKMSTDALQEKIKEVRQTATRPEDLLSLSLLHAQLVWKDVLSVRDNKEFIEATDETRISSFELKYPEFFKKYPVIAKYLVCRGVFSLEAFRQFLVKCKNEAGQQHTDKKKKIKAWCHLRAYYVQQAWKYMNMNKGNHPSESDQKYVYNEAFKYLMEDYDSFTKEQEDAEESMRKNELTYKADAIEYIIDHLDEFDDASYDEAVKMIEEFQRRASMDAVINEVKKKIEPLRAAITGSGKGIDMSGLQPADNF